MHELLKAKLMFQTYERQLVSKLKKDTLSLIHNTLNIPAIKKLILAHEILDLNETIFDKYSKNEEPCWDIASIQDLKTIGHELFVYHRMDFNPSEKIVSYSNKISNLYIKVIETLKN